MVWIGRDLKNNLVLQPHCHEWGPLPLDQAGQNSIQIGLKDFQGWGLHNFSEQHWKLFMGYYKLRKKPQPFSGAYRIQIV